MAYNNANGRAITAGQLIADLNSKYGKRSCGCKPLRCLLVAENAHRNLLVLQKK
jgi:hypothetical protein